MPPKRNVVLGVKARTGSAAVVALAGSAAEPRVVAKRRLVMATTFETGAVYHMAQERPLPEAESWVRQSERTFDRIATESLGALLAELRAADLKCIAGVLVAAPPRPPLPLEAILKAHPRLHAAEGELYRAVIERASAACDIPIRRIAPTDLTLRAAKAAGLGGAELARHLAALGKASGPPWTKDEKDCALAAWSLLG